MNFFKSILSDDPDPSSPRKSHDSEPNYPTNNPSHEIREETGANVSDNQSSHENPNPNSSSTGGGGGGWIFGGLVKTFATRSESMLEVYKRDLQEFGSGLRKETEIIREAASRAVKELPASIEVGASVAQGSLESVTHAFDGVLKSTAEIISQGKESLLASSDVESETPDATSRVSNSGRYSRFDAQLSVLQNDANTYCEEPDDSEEYKKWKSGFALEEKSEEVVNLIGENGVLEGVYKGLVPNVVDSDTFWFRYFYRVHKLKQQENMRANLVKRAISVDDEEELSWDVDDDDYSDQDQNGKSKGDNIEKKALDVPNPSPVERKESTNEEIQNVGSGGTIDMKGEEDIVESSNEKAAISEETSSGLKNEDKVVKVAENVSSSEGGNGKGVDHGESGKDSDVSVISSQPSAHEEEDLGWDEIEDLGSDDDKKDNPITRGGSSNSSDLRKRLSAAEEDEDLSWDIEDDDEPVKS
ncbi:hypothetical protein M9H77_01564 [Catharanthus roseus]|uniref:Uncharacterized protein n=1 Tax=Catharanthus roseus TaxID=4058 RepID=A0ACC0C653_CATRO|nr:hypothetical protein M9H77_01564 [Catharanthus roseus]